MQAPATKAIQSYLFRDVYEWAGQFRTIPLAKAEDIRGGRVIRFTPPNLIEQELTKVFDELANEHFLEGLQRREFAHNVAALLSDINRIHPFREGNGRAQRQFVRQLADSLGYKLHFEVVSKECLIQASILSANGDLAMMERLLDEITDTERIQSLAKLIAHLEGNQFDWNDIYLATTTPGQSYVGTFAGSDGANFFFRDEESRIFGRKSQGSEDAGEIGRENQLHKQTKQGVCEREFVEICNQFAPVRISSPQLMSLIATYKYLAVPRVLASS